MDEVKHCVSYCILSIFMFSFKSETFFFNFCCRIIDFCHEIQAQNTDKALLLAAVLFPFEIKKKHSMKL